MTAQMRDRAAALAVPHGPAYRVWWLVGICPRCEAQLGVALDGRGFGPSTRIAACAHQRRAVEQWVAAQAARNARRSRAGRLAAACRRNR